MAETKAPRRLDEALRPGGLYYTTDGTPHDAHGNVLEGAPKRPDNTAPEDQPFSKLAAMTSVGPGGAPSGFDMRALGMAIAQGLKLGAEGADDLGRTAISEAQSQRDELASAAAEAKPAAPEPGKVTSVADIRPGVIIPTKEQLEAAAAIAPESPAGSKTAPTSPAGTSDEGLPTISDLPATVGRLKTVAEVQAMARRDDRVTAEKIYDARIDELEAER